MSNKYFKFKQFTIFHDKCAMKVGTDGVLLGICANVEQTQSILDIGTGTGLIALMLAQRTQNNVLIDAIDIDTDAICQATENIQNSSFRTISCIHTTLQAYILNCTRRYDLIISNPPFFTSSIVSPDQKRTLARHTESLTPHELIGISAQLLSQNGRIVVIYPYSEKDLLETLAIQNELHITHITNIYPTLHSQPKRIIFEFSRQWEELATENLLIETERHIYSPEFIELAKDFYLKL